VKEVARPTSVQEKELEVTGRAESSSKVSDHAEVSLDDAGGL